MQGKNPYGATGVGGTDSNRHDDSRGSITTASSPATPINGVRTTRSTQKQEQAEVAVDPLPCGGPHLQHRPRRVVRAMRTAARGVEPRGLSLVTGKPGSRGPGLLGDGGPGEGFGPDENVQREDTRAKKKLGSTVKAQLKDGQRDTDENTTPDDTRPRGFLCGFVFNNLFGGIPMKGGLLRPVRLQSTG